MTDPILSIVIGTLNRRDLLEKCISSIFEQTRTPFHVYITDAGSTDGTIDYLNTFDRKRLSPIFVGRKLGQAKAYNDVFKAISSKYVCWLSDDNVIVNRSLDVAVEILEGNSSISMVGLKVKDIVGPFSNAPYIGGVSSAGILNVNQGLLRTSAMQEAGYFSEMFGFYGIDPDLTAKVLHTGRDIVYTRTIAIHHYRNWNSDTNSPDFAALQQNQEKYRQLYQTKYGHLGQNDLFWRAKKSLWRLIRRAVGIGAHYSLDGQHAFLGYIVRDWTNVFESRHISLFDRLRSRGKTFYLRQHCPWYKKDPSVLDDRRTMDSFPAVGQRPKYTCSLTEGKPNEERRIICRQKNA